MVPLNPMMHCNHIGRNGGIQPDGTPGHKCVDAEECSDPNQSNGWPDVGNVNGNYPSYVVQAAQLADNNGNPNLPNFCSGGHTGHSGH